MLQVRHVIQQGSSIVSLRRRTTPAEQTQGWFEVSLCGLHGWAAGTRTEASLDRVFRLLLARGRCLLRRFVVGGWLHALSKLPSAGTETPDWQPQCQILVAAETAAIRVAAGACCLERRQLSSGRVRKIPVEGSAEERVCEMGLCVPSTGLGILAARGSAVSDVGLEASRCLAS